MAVKVKPFPFADLDDLRKRWPNFPDELAETAVEGAEGHTEDHNAIYEVLREVQGNVDAAEGKAAWGGVTGKPATFPAADHKHAAGDIDSGTLDAARIPTLAQSKITGLAAKITELEGRLDALEAPEAG